MRIGNQLAGEHFRGANCLVTGGAGFIGSNIVSALLNAGARVKIIDDFSTGSTDNVPDAPTVECIQGDVGVIKELSSLVSRTDYVFHCAAQVGNVRSLRSPMSDCRSNILATVRLIEACRDSEVAKIVYSSSSAIFGEARYLPVDEEHPIQPESYYALSKLTGERYLRLGCDIASMPVVCLRYFNAYGIPMERSEYAGVISIFLDQISAGRPLVVYGDGEQLRDFIHVDDVVQANLLAAAYASPGSVFNVGRGIPVNVNRLTEIIMSVCETEVEVKYESARRGEVRNSVADISRIETELGFRPDVDLEEGLRDIWSRLY